MGAKYNMLSYGVWCQLGKTPLSKSIIQVKGVNKKKTTVFGMWHTSVSYDNGVVAQDFLVMPVGTMEGNINLGHTWMIATKCTIDWGTGGVTTQKPTLIPTTQAIVPEILPKEIKPKTLHVQEVEPYVPIAQLSRSSTDVVERKLETHKTHRSITRKTYK
ncbi:hypothetical protein DD595_24790 [Enterobacter cloacae complex sp. 4DZ3-17B2]|nr:hypothetical protein DD595_24790 [Enterobacter cloacae complex sp. 4DZ3-17B2]